MKRPRGRRSRPDLLTSLAVVLWVATALAAESRTATAATVVLVRAPQPSSIATEATVRLRGELVAAGFDVRVIDPPAGGDVRSSLEQSAAGPGVEAVVAIVVDPGDGQTNFAELWVIDRVTGKTVVRRVRFQSLSVRAAEVLSVRALELLRASFMEVALAAKETRAVAAKEAPALTAETPPSPEVRVWTDAALAEAVENRWPNSWAIEAGGCVRGSLDGVEPSLMPLVRIQHAFGDHLLGRVTIAGLGTASKVTYNLSATETARAEVVQQFVLVESAWRWRRDHRLQPLVSAGLGALHVAGTGQAQLPYGGLSSDRWAVLVDIGAGAHVTFARRFELAMEVHAQAAQPYPVIRFLGQEVAREGRPTLISTLSLLAWM